MFRHLLIYNLYHEYIVYVMNFSFSFCAKMRFISFGLTKVFMYIIKRKEIYIPNYFAISNFFDRTQKYYYSDY